MRRRPRRPRAPWCAAFITALACNAGAPEEIATGPVAREERGGASAGADLEGAAVSYARGLAGELSLSADDDFAALPLPDGAGGLRRVRLQQLHRGLPVVGSEIEIHADPDTFVGLGGVLTRNLDGFDVEPAIDAARAGAIASADLSVVAPRADRTVASADLVILPRAGGGADLAWQVELAGGWRTFVDARGGQVIGAMPVATGCSLWEKLKCKVGAGDCEACSAVCGDGTCSGDETDASCRQDCGCSAPGELCGTFVPAPFGCWCDADCAESGDCCADVAMCDLPPAPGGAEGDCGWGEQEAGFFDKARLSFYRAKYFAIAQGGALMGMEDAARYLLHFLGNSGSEMDVDVDRMLEEIPSFAEAVKAKRTEYAEQAAADAEARDATGTVRSATPAEWESGAAEASESENWYYAIHLFNWNHTGNVSVTPAGDRWSFDVEGVVHVSDYYDWDPDDSGGIFDQSELYELHCYGWAQNFWIKGMSSESSHQGTTP